MKKIYKTIDKLPLAGKFAVGSAMEAYVRSSPEKERRNFVTTSALLGFFVLVHGYQAKLGIDSLSAHVTHLDETGTATDALWAGLDVSYAAINAAVTVRQAERLYTLNQIRHRKVARRAKMATPVRTANKPAKDTEPSPQTASYVKRGLGSMGLALTVTLGGQAAFITSAYDALADTRAQEAKQRCITFAETEIKDLEHSLTSVGIQYEKNMLATECHVSPTEITVPHQTIPVVSHLPVPQKLPNS